MFEVCDLEFICDLEFVIWLFYLGIMRILITSGVYPPDIGGPARMIERLVLDLRESNFDVCVLTFGQSGDENEVHRANSKLDFFIKLKKLAPKFDVIYTFDLYTAGFLSWLVGKKIFNKKLVVRFAGDSAWELASNKGQTNDDILTFQKKFYGLSVAWHKWLRKQILGGADKVVVVSEFMKTVATGIGVPEEKIKVIYNSVDFTSYELPDHHKLNNYRVILTIGRLVPWKGVDLLIKALAKLNNKELKLLIVGDGPDLSRLKKLVDDERVIEQVEFVGKVPLDEVFNYYDKADMFVLDSQYEGLSHVLLEALKAGKPIIASRSGGNPEVIKNEQNGLLVDYGNVDQLVVSIKRILIEKKWQSTEFKNDCADSLKKFNWQNVIQQTSKIINDLNHE